MNGIGWPEVLAMLTSIGFGMLSAVVPLVNAELYVVASQVSELAGAEPIAVGVAIGQTVGKCLLFLGVRQGRRLVATRPASERVHTGWRARFDAVMQKLLTLVGRKRWGLPITFLAAVVGLPPLYAVALLAGATKMRLGWFAAVVLVGRLIRFLLVANGVHLLTR